MILEIKAASWRHPEYRRGFTSGDVYAAVLDRGVRDVPGFWADLRETKGIPEAPVMSQSLHKQRRKFEHETMDRRDAAEDLPNNPNEDANASAEWLAVADLRLAAK